MLRTYLTRVFLFSALVVSAFLRQASAVTQVNVTVKDQNNNPLPSVYVMAVEFSGEGVGPNTRVGWTNSVGSATFNLNDHIEYHFFATTQSYGPTFREQVFNPGHPRRWGDQGVHNININLSSGLTNRALVLLDLTNGTANGLACEGFNRKGSDEELAMSITQLDGAGAGTAYLFNVPADSTSREYETGSFDTGSNRHVGVTTTTVITAGQTYTFDIDFNDLNALPPDTVASQGDSSVSGSSAFSASIEGVVISTFNKPGTNQPYSIPHIGIELRQMSSGGGGGGGGNNTFGAGWANADQNGRFKFFNLTAGTTYFIRTFSGCTFGGSPVCFKGYESPAFSTGGTPALNDFLYVGGTQIKKVQLEAAPQGTGKMEVLVQDEKGRPVRGAHINIWPDGSPWHYGSQNYQTDTNHDSIPENRTAICDPASGGDGDGIYHHYNQVDRNEPGLTNFNGQTTGYTLISNLLPGNYQIQVWTQFSNSGLMYNAGSDGIWDWNWGHRGCGPNTGQQSQGGGGGGGSGPANSADDLRVTITTNTNARGTNVFVYTTSGTLKGADGSENNYDDYANAVNISSVVVVVKLKPKPAGARLIQGTLTFPQVVDLRNEPITIIAQRQCDPSSDGQTCWQDGGFAVIEGSGSASYDYSIPVGSSPASYWVNVESGFWGVVRQSGGNDSLNLMTVSTGTKNFTFARAGKISGNVYKPDGSKFIPGQTENGYLSGNVSANSDSGWGWTQVQNDGSYTLGGLLPGKYELDFQSWGDTQAAGKSLTGMPEPKPEVQVVAQQTVNADIKTVNNEVVLVDVDTSTFPSLKSVTTQHGDIQGERWSIIRLPAGRALNGGTITGILTGRGSWKTEFGLTVVGNSTSCGPITLADRTTGGLRWCPQKLPSGNIYDVYFLRRGSVDTEGEGEATYEYFIIIGSSKNIQVNSSRTSLPMIKYQSPTPNVKPVRVNMQPAVPPTPGVVLGGTVTANNMFRQADFNQLGGDFNNFMRFIPVVTVFDSSGSIIGAGLVTPPPVIIDGGHDEDCVLGVGPYPKLDFNRNCADDFEEAILNQDWPTFSNAFNILTSSYGWQYEIRGLPAGQSVNLVITTPNYPPYSTQVTFGVQGSTTVQHFNLDQLVGTGNTIAGIVTSTQTANNVIANATVVLEAQGYEKKTAVTNSSGAYRFEGLPAGNFKITANAAGYNTQVKNQSATGNTSFTVNFALTQAGQSSIHGVVYSQRIPFARTQPGVKLLAYDDTFNAQNPNEPLALLKAVTNSTGAYSFTGLVTGHVYKLFLVVPGKYVLSQSTLTVDGAVAGVDFDMLTRPLEVDVFGKIQGSNYEFRIKNPKDFADGDAWVGETPFVKANSAHVGDRFEQLPNNELLLKWPLENVKSTATYVLHIEAKNLAGKEVTQELEFGLGNSNKAKLPVDVQILGDDSEDSSGRKNNQASIDREASGDPSGISFPAGAAIATSSSAIPALNMAAQSTSTIGGSSVLAKLTSLRGSFMGSIYDITVSSMNFTGKPVTLTLKYDKNTVGGNISNLKIASYDPVGDKWTTLNGALTVDPTLGTVSINIDPTSTASGFYVQNRYGAQSLARAGTMSAINDGKQFLSRGPMALSSGSGSFAVVVAASSTVTAAGYRQYNFPNPFNLKSKTVTIRGGNPNSIATTITGTYIVIAPTGSGTVNVKIRIYNVAGDLVREISETAAAGVYNYFHWDGKNKSGEEVASGVYFAVVDAPGSDKKKPVKLVVVK